MSRHGIQTRCDVTLVIMLMCVDFQNNSFIYICERERFVLFDFADFVVDLSCVFYFTDFVVVHYQRNGRILTRKTFDSLL